MTEFSCILILSFLGFISALLIRPAVIQYLLNQKYVKLPNLITSLLTRIFKNKGVSLFDELCIFLLLISMVPGLRFIYHTFSYFIKLSSILGYPLFPSSFLVTGLMSSQLAFLLYSLLIVSLYFHTIYNYVLTRGLQKSGTTHGMDTKLKQRNLLIIGVLLFSFTICIDFIFALMLAHHRVF